MNLTDIIPAAPIQVQKSVRRDKKRLLTSGPAGRIMPLAFFPVLRGDRVSRGGMDLHFKMGLTPQMLLNGVTIKARAYFVSWLCFDRFTGMDDFNRSYKGVPEASGSVIPFITTGQFSKAAPFWKILGAHAVEGSNVNFAPVEAYNKIVNHLYRARAAGKLPERAWNDTTLAPCFWNNPTMADIVPDFDSAMIDGEVPLTVVSAQLPLRKAGSALTTLPVGGLYTGGGIANTNLQEIPSGVGSSASASAVYVKKSPTQVVNPVPTVDFTGVYAELAQQGIKVTLSNLELAKQTVEFAKLRQQFDGIEEEYLVDLLMSGIQVPEIALRQPILLDQKETLFGFNRRWATDAANLDESRTQGEAMISLTMRTPEMNTGGLVMVVAEIVPEQLFERKLDNYLFTGAGDQSSYPEFVRDYLDPEKVEIVYNRDVDCKHSQRDAVFGYAALNRKWKRDFVNVGGKFYRPDANTTFDEDRQQLWACEQVDPTLNEDWYLAKNIHTKVFADTVSDPFEIQGRAELEIVGNTVFGVTPQVDSGNYDAIAAKVPTTRIVQE